jgi:hypothetical protein
MRMPAAPAAPQGFEGLVALPEFVYELRGADSEVLHRVAAPDPIPRDVEVFSDDPEHTVERAPHPPREGVFTVLVPEIEAAEEVRLLRSAAPRGLAAEAGPEAAAEAAVEVGRFKLTAAE